MKKILIFFLIASMLLSLCACGSNGDKKKLCEGIWAYYYTDYSHAYAYTWRVFDFSTKGSFTYTVHYTHNPVLKGSKNIWKEQYYSGTYKIDTKNCQILMKYDKDDVSDDMPKKIPYYLNEYTHEMVFYTDEKGQSSYKYYSSIEDLFSNYISSGYTIH